MPERWLSSPIGRGSMISRSCNVVCVVMAWTAHITAWATGVWLAVGPVYEGVSSTSTLPGEPAGEFVPFTSNLIEVDGFRAVLFLTVPILSTGVAVWSVHRTDAGKILRKVLVWVPAAALLSFCAISVASIGMLYVPAALLLLIAAVANSIGTATEQR